MSIAMDKENKVGEKIHLSNLDEFLATALMESKEKPVKLAIQKEGNEGYVSASILRTTGDENIGGNGVDFELSPCECLDFDSMEVSDFLEKPVLTSSAYELFDFVLMFFDSLECLVDFEGNAWKIKMLNYVPTSN
jgi:hypothetical protein